MVKKHPYFIADLGGKTLFFMNEYDVSINYCCSGSSIPKLFILMILKHVFKKKFVNVCVAQFSIYFHFIELLCPKVETFAYNMVVKIVPYFLLIKIELLYFESFNP